MDWFVFGPSSGTLAAGTWNLNNGGGRSAVLPAGATGQAGEELTLRFRHIHGDGSYLAIDNIHVEQLPAP